MPRAGADRATDVSVVGDRRAACATLRLFARESVTAAADCCDACVAGRVVEVRAACADACAAGVADD